jgi:soluble lytic murein transglycosylase-like protein
MTNPTYIQQGAHTHVRNNKQGSRVRMALAGSGIAGALLLGGLFGSHVGSAPNSALRTSAPVVSNSASASSMTTAQMSYRLANNYVGMARQAAQQAGINPNYFVRQIQQESGFNPNATSPSGAVGIAQFMPATAASMGINPHNPAQALNGAARMMAGLSRQFGGNYAKALAAYNAGGGAVQSAVARGGGNWLSCMPGETQNYVRIIMG